MLQVIKSEESMKTGDLVKCVWQPKVAEYNSKKQCLLPMTIQIENKAGFITEVSDNRCRVLFPQFGYSHILAFSVLEVISEYE